MDKKNLKYQIYFTKLNRSLRKLNNQFLYYIPDLYKKDLRKDKIPIIKVNIQLRIKKNKRLWQLLHYLYQRRN